MFREAITLNRAKYVSDIIHDPVLRSALCKQWRTVVDRSRLHTVYTRYEHSSHLLQRNATRYLADKPRCNLLLDRMCHIRWDWLLGFSWDGRNFTNSSFRCYHLLCMYYIPYGVVYRRLCAGRVDIMIFGRYSQLWGSILRINKRLMLASVDQGMLWLLNS